MDREHSTAHDGGTDLKRIGNSNKDYGLLVIAVVGPVGVGKSTFIKLVTRDESIVVGDKPVRGKAAIPWKKR